ncbi:HAD family hydrolase [Kitasatospora sp. NBC_01246]|uniref:HAD family hydrolase n=1 Tax=Kitasatospora sp. NBC_01246 TaxID=2903570 RepID=UPI002E338C0F|nr:Cof-type HAD-IIB family hydrolase [Kitasatospora sp. NBC_01246]
MTAPTRRRPPPFGVVATDLDGTLLRGDLSLSARTRAALARAEASGALHLVVTGRAAAGCRTLLERLDYRGLAVCGQGAQLYDVGADRLLSSQGLHGPTVRPLVARIAEQAGPLRLAVVTAGLTGDFLVTPGFESRLRHGWRLAESPDDLWARPVDKVLIRHDHLGDDELAALARRVCADEVAVTHSGEGLVELLPAGVSKASGLAAAAALLGFTPADTIAFGDMPNDIPMIEWAGYGVAMGNAHAELRRRADETAPSNEEDGVAVVLERFFPPDAGRSAADRPAAAPSTTHRRESPTDVAHA